METNNYNAFWKFIRFLHDNGFLDHIMLIGSWVEHVYQQAGLLKDYQAALRTLDVDFKNKMMPKERMHLPKEARANGYIVSQDRLMNTSKIYTVEENLEIEFLIDQKGKGDEPVQETNLGIHAQALRNMSILSSHTVKLDIFGYIMTVPLPEAYVIHKMVISKDRAEAKRVKDVESIRNLIDYIDNEKFLEIYASLSNKSKSKVQGFLQEQLNLDISDFIKKGHVIFT